MVIVTDAARSLLAGILEKESLPVEVTVRLVFEDDSMAIEPGHQEDGDTVFDHEGRVVLVMDNQVTELLEGHSLDAEGENLTLRHSGE